MIMNKNKIIVKKVITVVSVVFVMLSCADLDLKPLSEGSSGNWYNNDEEFLMSLNDLMRKDFFPVDPMPITDDMFSRNEQQETRNGNLTSQTALPSDRWLTQYKAVSRALKILDNARNSKANILPANLKQYEGEALFHLGFSYATLATYYGDVVLDKEGMALSEAYSATRSPRREVLNYAYECLDAAAELLPPSHTTQLRPTSGAALAFKVRFALFHGDYQLAIEAAEKLISAGTYTLESSYGELFKMPYSNELIWFFQGNKDLRVESNDMFNTLNNYATRIVGGACNRGPSIQLVCAYLCTDGLPIDESPLYEPKNFWANRDPRLEYTVQPYILKNDPNYADYVRRRANEADYAAKIAAGQVNYADSTLVSYYPKYFMYGFEFAPGPYNAKILNPSTHAMVTNTDSKASNEHGAYNGFVMKKYVTEEWNDYRSLGTKAYNTFPYLRWAEILMSYVEAKNELGQCTQEILDNTINKVRERAYSESGLTYPPVLMGTQQELRKIIRMERRMEFPFEGIRYRDLIRWKIAEKVFNTAEYELARSWSSDASGNVNLTNPPSGLVPHLKNWDDGNYPIGGIPKIDEDGLPDVAYMVDQGIQTVRWVFKFDKTKNYLWPVPADDMLVNENLTQNPGY